MRKFDVRAYTDAPLQIQKTRIIKAPIEELWTIVSDHKGMTTWMPMIKQVDLVKHDGQGDWGEGCERNCQFGPDLLEEKIVFWDAPNGYAYSIKDMHLVKDHVAIIALQEAAEGTRVTWTQYFIPNSNPVKNFIAKNIMMPTVMSKALKNLESKIN